MKKQGNAIIGIYKITSPSGKIYIGQSTNIKQRWNIHKGKYNSVSTKLHRSLIKYGVDNHIFEIIEECSIEKLNEREIYWIKFYNSVKEGLNICLGGEGGNMAEETKQKISQAKTGHICYNSEKRNRKISNTLKGRKHTRVKGKEKQGKKQEYKFKENIIKLHSKSIEQFDNQNNFIREYVSIKEASSINNIHRENIGSVLRGKSKSAGGFIWRYKEN
jgi:group I intron endonuclease